jgi:glycosyltransferase involved in cell wall biosynthesis
LQEVLRGTNALARRFLSAFDGLIVNSGAEADAIARLVAPRLEQPWQSSLVPREQPWHSLTTQVVHSGVDAYYWCEDRDVWKRERRVLIPGTRMETSEEADEPPTSVERPDGEGRTGILCVARFDPQKGQHRLLRALEGIAVPVTLLGPDNPNYPGYRAWCRRLADPHVTILPRQSQQRLKQLYWSCRVHALCSWYETTGLTGLEAGCCGARVVMTDRGGTRDYGGDLAWYADPADLRSIRHAVEQALAAVETPDLAGHVRRHFTWETSARRLLEAYENVLAQPKRASLAA